MHYIDVIMTTMASQITSLTVIYSTVYSDADQSKHQSSASLAFVWGIHRDRWIPRTKGQSRGKCFHLMTSSWLIHYELSGQSGHKAINTPIHKNMQNLALIYRWFSASLQYLQCISNGDPTILVIAIGTEINWLTFLREHFLACKLLCYSGITNFSQGLS